MNIKELIRLADTLDKEGNHSAATKIDRIIKQTMEIK